MIFSPRDCEFEHICCSIYAAFFFTARIFTASVENPLDKYSRQKANARIMLKLDCLFSLCHGINPIRIKPLGEFE